MNRWTLYACDRTGVRQAEVDLYEKAEVLARINDVSTWSLSMPTDSDAGRIFASDQFARLEIAVDGAVWRSGPVTRIVREVDLDDDMLEITGADDTVWLQRRNAHPQPGTAVPPYSVTAYDVHTGSASQVLAELANVNAGPGAVAARRVPGLVVPVPAPAGPVITVSARWQNLLALLQDTARGAGLNFDVVDLTFTAGLPADRGAVFSAGLETLGAWKLTAPAPKANKAVVAGGGTGAARIIREISDATSIAGWGLVETFQDRRDTTDLAELDKAGTETVAAGVLPVSVAFTPLDSDGQAFIRDWGLGDRVTVRAGNLTVVDSIREVHVTLEPSGATVIPSVGAPTGDLALFRSLAVIERRVRQLERV